MYVKRATCNAFSDVSSVQTVKSSVSKYKNILFPIYMFYDLLNVLQI